jgi:predicted metal-dependent enzyme (double-stranded beta helix superfamily)
MLQGPSLAEAHTKSSAISASSLTRLISALDAACERPGAEKAMRIIAALQAAAAAPGFMTPDLRKPRLEGYARHPVWADSAGRFTVLSLVWGPGQFSPPHAHAAWCGYAVVENPLTETLYAFDTARQKAHLSGEAMREPGYACFAEAGLDQIHRLGNAGSEPAISLHVYGVDLARIGTHVNRLLDVAGQEG